MLHTQKAIDGRLALEIALNILQMPSLKGLDLQVKWPNDLYSLQGKWGGILIEPISTQQVVVGVGINVSPLTESIPDQQVTSLTELGLPHASRVDLIAELYLAIQQAGEWFNYGSQNLPARFNQYAAFFQQTVEFTDIQGQYSGTFLGIQDDGAVIIETNAGTQTFYQGNSVLKRWLNRHHSMKNYGWISAIHGSSTGLRSRTRSLNIPRKCICNPLPTYFLA